MSAAPQRIPLADAHPADLVAALLPLFAPPAPEPSVSSTIYVRMPAARAAQLASARRLAAEFRAQAAAKPPGDLQLAKARLFENGGYQPEDIVEHAAALRAIARALRLMAAAVSDEDEAFTQSLVPSYSERKYLRAQATQKMRAASTCASAAASEDTVS